MYLLKGADNQAIRRQGIKESYSRERGSDYWSDILE